MRGRRQQAGVVEQLLIEYKARGIRNWKPVGMNLIVQVGARGSSRIPYESNLLISFYRLPLFDQGSFKMGISGSIAVTVADGQHFPIAVIPFHRNHNAISRSNNRCFLLVAYVKTSVKFLLAGERRNPVAERRTDPALDRPDGWCAGQG